MYFTPNLSMLWSDLPLADRFARAAAAGFRAVELWWPGDEVARTLPGLCEQHGLRVALLNFDGGDLAAGERGLAADPRHQDRLREHVPAALRIARDCGCQRLNLLVGRRRPEYSPGQQLACAQDNLTWAADQAAMASCEITIEALNPFDSGPCLLSTTTQAAAFIAGAGRPNVRLQYDAYHMQQTEGNLTATIDAHWDLIGHVQIADVPGRHEPGTGEINYRFLLQHLDRRGYRGAVGLEYWPSGGQPPAFGWLADYGWSPDRA
jgi:hydroxypyruvate isomerase